MQAERQRVIGIGHGAIAIGLRRAVDIIAIEEPTGASCLEHEDHPGRRLGAMRTGLTIGPPEDIAMTIEALGAGARG